MILGLSLIHSQRVVHRDFLPENIMIAADTGHIRIVDFGSAKQLRLNERTYTAGHIPVYAAPEVLSGGGHDCNVDIWSLGILICELLSGQTPFEAPTVLQVYERINCGLMRFNARITAAVRSLL